VHDDNPGVSGGLSMAIMGNSDVDFLSYSCCRYKLEEKLRTLCNLGKSENKLRKVDKLR